MKSKIVLTSLVVMGLAYPGLGRAETFPSDGYMQENKTYESAATYKNIGAYDGTVSATAEYDDVLYQVLAGTYLPAGSEGETQACPAGSFCPGITDATYNESDNQGISQCPSGYPNSESGAGSNTQCYTACTLTVADIEHATAVSGNDYYGSGVDTCVATACENGYHVTDGVQLIERDPLIDVDVATAGNDYAYVSADGSNTRGKEDYSLTENNTWASVFDYGTVYGRASCQSAIHSEGMGYVLSVINDLVGGTMAAEDLRSGLEPIVGAARADAMVAAYEAYLASAKAETDQEAFFKAVYQLFAIADGANYSTTDSGQYCYCQMTDYAADGGEKSSVAAAPWVFLNDGGSASVCASNCALDCAYGLHNGGVDDRVFRGAVFGSLGASSAGTCDANEISITWTDADPADVSANNAGMCTFGGDIRTPVKATTKPGKTFKGWKFGKAE